MGLGELVPWLTPRAPIAMPPTLQLKLLGGTRLEGPDGPLTGTATQRRPLAVLSLLAASAGGMSRDRVVAFLWPESDAERARHALAQLLYALRQQLGSEAIVSNATALRLDADIVSSDVHELDAALTAGEYARAAELYAGPFLDGFYLTGCDEFERWVTQERARIAQRIQAAIDALVTQATSAGDAVEAVRWNRRLATLAPFDSRIAIGLMSALVRAGDRAGAIAHARVHESMVRQELDTAPDPEVTAFAASLIEAPASRIKTVPRDVSPLRMVDQTIAVPARSAADEVLHADEPLKISPIVRRRYWLNPLPVALTVLVLAVGALTIALTMPARRSGPPDWLVVADVENASGEPIFDRTVSVALTAAIGQSPRIYIVPPERIRQTLVLMRRPSADTAFVEALAREVAEREGARAVLVPSIAKTGTSYEIVARLVDPASGGLIGVVHERAPRREVVLDALDRAGKALRRKLGESMFSVASRSVALPRVTTGSLEALQKYVEGARAFQNSQFVVAQAHWKQAVVIDTGFAVAYAALGMLNFYSNLPAEGNRYFERALTHIGALPERDQVLIRSQVSSWRGDREASVAMLRTYVARHPDDLTTLGRLGFDYLRLARHPEAIATLTRIIKLDSLDPDTFINLATAERALGQYAAALIHYRRAFELAPDRETANNSVNLEYGTTHVRQGHLDSAALVFEKMLRGDQNTRARGLRSVAFLEMYRGRYTAAVRHLGEAIELSRSSNARISELRNRLLMASALDMRGRKRDAAAQRDSAYALVVGADVESTLLFWTGKALARAGDVRRATLLLARLEKSARGESATDRAALEALRGELLVARGRAADAMPQMENALRADSSAVVLESAARGAMRAGAIDRAIVLYRRLENVRAFGWEGQEHSRTASYWLGRLEETRDANVAIAAYRRFLNDWREGEPDLALVADARTRLLRLQPGDVAK